MQAEQPAVGGPVEHSIPKANSVLPFAKERDELAHVELCAALATLLPAPRLLWYLHYVWLCTLNLNLWCFGLL